MKKSKPAQFKVYPLAKILLNSRIRTWIKVGNAHQHQSKKITEELSRSLLSVRFHN